MNDCASGQVLSLQVTEADDGGYRWGLFTLAGRELRSFSCEDCRMTVGKFLECVRGKSNMELELHRNGEPVRDPLVILQQGENIAVKDPGLGLLLQSVACGDVEAAQHALPVLLQVAKTSGRRGRGCCQRSVKVQRLAVAEGLGICAVAGQELAERAAPALVELAAGRGVVSSAASRALRTAAQHAHVAKVLEQVYQDGQRRAVEREKAAEAIWAAFLQPRVEARDVAVAKRALGLLHLLASSASSEVRLVAAKGFEATLAGPEFTAELVEQALPALLKLAAESTEYGCNTEVAGTAFRVLQTLVQATYVATMLEQVCQDGQRRAAEREKAAEAIWTTLLQPRVEARDVAAAKRALGLLHLLASSASRKIRLVAAKGFEACTLAGPELAAELVEQALPALLKLAAESTEYKCNTAVASTAFKLLQTLVEATDVATMLGHVSQDGQRRDAEREKAAEAIWSALLQPRVEARDVAAAKRALGLLPLLASSASIEVRLVAAKGFEACTLAGPELTAELVEQALPALLKLAAGSTEYQFNPFEEEQVTEVANTAFRMLQTMVQPTFAQAAHVAAVLEQVSQDGQRRAAEREKAAEVLWAALLQPRVEARDVAAAKRAVPLLLELATSVDEKVCVVAADGLKSCASVGPELAEDLGEQVLLALLYVAANVDYNYEEVALRALRVAAAVQEMLRTIAQSPHAAAALEELAGQDEPPNKIPLQAATTRWNGLLRTRVEAGGAVPFGYIEGLWRRAAASQTAARHAMPALLRPKHGFSRFHGEVAKVETENVAGVLEECCWRCAARASLCVGIALETLSPGLGLRLGPGDLPGWLKMAKMDDVRARRMATSALACFATLGEESAQKALRELALDTDSFCQKIADRWG